MSERQTAFPMDRPAVEVQVGPDRAAGSLAPVRESSTAISTMLDRLKVLFSFPAMLGTLLFGVTFYSDRDFIVDPDLWWHVKIGRDILSSHHWPTTDPYSFTAMNAPWIAYEWLGEVVLGTAAKLGGNAALDALLVLLGGAIILALYVCGTLRSGNSKAGFVAALILIPLALPSFTLRPQMFGYFFLPLLLIALEQFRKGAEWTAWCLPALFLVWVNTHGSFIVGIGVLAVYLCSGLRSFRLGSVEAVAWTSRQRIKLEIALLLSLVVLPVTPYGTQLAAYPFDMMFNQPVNIANVHEWKSMPFDQSFGKLFLGVTVLLIVLQIIFRFNWRLAEFVLAVGAAVMACVHARMLLIFVPLVAPLFATVLARWLPPYQRLKDQFVLNAILMAGAIAAMIYYAPSRNFLQDKVEKHYPVAAVHYLDVYKIPGPMLNSYTFGGYLVENGRKTFIDGRGDLFERAGVLSDYLTLVEIKIGAFSVLDRYQIASCLLMRDEPLGNVLTASPNWKRVYVDDTSALFVRIALNQPKPEK
jgi:hypothetical protein